MNRQFTVLFLIISGILLSCNDNNRSEQTIPVVEKSDSCQADPGNTYEIFIPERTGPSVKLPLFVIIDAHGSGKYALKRFKPGARRYQAIVVTSSLVKNGFSDYESAIRMLIDDVRTKYPAGPLLFISGFSGGARMALRYALEHPLNGLILCGALASPGQINALRCPLISISGMDDFNFMETAQYLLDEKSIPANLMIELTNTAHSWPDSLLLSNAMGFLCLSSPSAAVPSPAQSQLDVYCQMQQSRIDSLKKKADYLKAALISRNMSLAAPFNKDNDFGTTYNDLVGGSGYMLQIDQLKNSLNFEMNARQYYTAAFTEKDSLWWKNQIIKIDEKINKEQDAYVIDMYRRIKGFWGIACYSFSRQAVKAHNAQMLNKIRIIYRMLEPQNPDMFYFSALFYFWQGDNQTTLALLTKAREAGFSDMKQLRTDFPQSITEKLK